MKAEIKTIITLTKEERVTIKELYNILDSDNNLDANDVWDILTDIIVGEDSVARNYGYTIRIED